MSWQSEAEEGLREICKNQRHHIAELEFIAIEQHNRIATLEAYLVRLGVSPEAIPTEDEEIH